MDIRDSVPDWGPYEQPRAPEDAPNVLYIVLDDVGFGALSCFGGLIETPNIDRIAQNGVRYTQWHTTALCSPTRSCLLTGRNHTTNGMACITECATGFPGSNGHIPFENATIAEMLVERGYNTYLVGKWHLCPEDEMNLAATKRHWPLGPGFDAIGALVDVPDGPAEGVLFAHGSRFGGHALYVKDKPALRLRLRRQCGAKDQLNRGDPQRP
jgi:arylsulfatase A-like enzyme